MDTVFAAPDMSESLRLDAVRLNAERAARRTIEHERPDGIHVYNGLLATGIVSVYRSRGAAFIRGKVVERSRRRWWSLASKSYQISFLGLTGASFVAGALSLLINKERIR